MAREKNNLDQKANHQLDKTRLQSSAGIDFSPGAHLQEYWDNILNKMNCITRCCFAWMLSIFMTRSQCARQNLLQRGGFIPDIDFDPTELVFRPTFWK